jgi:hypothetical protein
MQAGQRRNLEFGPYKWRVLEVQDGRVMLIAEDVVEDRAFHGAKADAKWDSSDLRKYLNSNFLQKFTAGDQSLILETTISNPEHPKFGTPGCPDTADRIFLLSIEEAESYFADDRDRSAGKMWWLRSHGHPNSAARVNSDGSIYEAGGALGTARGLRPALWLKAEGISYGGLSKLSVIAPKIRSGERRNLPFGPYMWRVLEVKGDLALLITENVAVASPYHGSQEAVTWDSSFLRSYLNGTFLQTFKSHEQSLIVNMMLENHNNPDHGTDGGPPTMDKIFVLSIQDAAQYFSDDGDRSAGETWWLRSPGIDSAHAACVGGEGAVYGNGNSVEGYSGARPAIWLNLRQ